uniref:MAK10-like protein n=1 Tax=Tanacetum cinerariifolium TaxID=118510 RepID=A0A6L2JU85_TANCI|nr:MAK10-like protein [Tanacetum cinerariifolium]
MENKNPIRTLGDYSRPGHEGFQNTIELSKGNNVMPLRPDIIRLLRDKNSKESWALSEDLALYDNESWNDPRDYAKPVKAISLPKDVPNISDRRLIELKNQVQCLIEAHIAFKSSVQVTKIASSYARLSKFKADFKQKQGEITSKIDTVLKALNDRMMRTLPSDMAKNPKLNVNSTSPVLYARSYLTKDPQFSSHIHDPKMSQVVLGKPFVKISNVSYDLYLRVVKFTDVTNEISYKMPHKIEQYNSLSDLEKEHTKSVYLRNEEDKRRVEYVMNKILGFYKECLELGPKYLTGLEDEGGVT